jgi:hypothetical protein
LARTSALTRPSKLRLPAPQRRQIAVIDRSEFAAATDRIADGSATITDQLKPSLSRSFAGRICRDIRRLLASRVQAMSFPGLGRKTLSGGFARQEAGADHDTRIDVLVQDDPAITTSPWPMS